MIPYHILDVKYLLDIKRVEKIFANYWSAYNFSPWIFLKSFYFHLDIVRRLHSNDIKIFFQLIFCHVIVLTHVSDCIKVLSIDSGVFNTVRPCNFGIVRVDPTNFGISSLEVAYRRGL